jgi:hypothetical protein
MGWIYKWWIIVLFNFTNIKISNNETWKNNPIFEIKVEKESTFEFYLNQITQDKNLPISIHLFKDQIDKKNVIEKSLKYDFVSSTSISKKLEVGLYFIMVSTFNQNQFGDFNLFYFFHDE